jgi:hypothetical protein
MFQTIQRRDGCLGFFVTAHFDESKPLAPARVAIVDDLRRDDLAVCTEQLFQLRTIHLIAQVADVQLLTHLISLKWAKP